MTKRRISWLILGVAVLIVCGGVILFALSHPAKSPSKTTTPSNDQSSQQPSQPVFDKTANSLTDPNSPWVVVNKQHPLNPADYTPADIVTIDGFTVRVIAQADLEALLADASQQSIVLAEVSSYRSYDYQVDLYNSYVAQYGVAETDTFSARPGYSEHQTGLAIDFGSSGSCELDNCFGSTPAGQWLHDNAWQYGFILRYPADKQSITGYESEPWHYRYVGRSLSAAMHQASIETLEEFFNVSGGGTYNS